jgi:outer membrane protein assembly factor BamB
MDRRGFSLSPGERAGVRASLCLKLFLLRISFGFRPSDFGLCGLVAFFLLSFPPPLPAADQPQWGQPWSRNMVSAERGLPDSFAPATGHNIKWSARLGTETHSSPIIAGGRVYIGTNNGEPRDSKHDGDRGVLMCFDEQTGKFLWQLVVPKREEDVYFDWPKSGIASSATVEGDRVYLVSNRGEVMCLDVNGMANGNDGPFMDEDAHMTPTNSPTVLRHSNLDADIIWLFNLTTGAGIWSHDAAHSSILIYGDYLYLNTSTGVDNTHKRIRTPDAPSLVVLDKRSGRLIARENEHMAPNIFHNTWSSPSMAEVNGKPLLFFAGGNGILYAFEPLLPRVSRRDADQISPRNTQHATRDSDPRHELASSPTATNAVQSLNKVWQFDFDPTAPKTNVHKYNSNRREGPSNFYGMPVFYKNRIYIAGGGDIWWGKNEAWLKCIDATGHGDITAKGLLWSYPLQKHVLSTVAISDGLVFIADCGRLFHCVDAETGKPLWTHEIKGDVWASPLVADGKVYLGTRSGNFYVFKASREKQVLSELELGNPISSTATAANGVLYVTTMTHLYALKAGKN